MVRPYLIAYDISDNKSRTRIFENLKDLGLSPVQNSVFWGYLTVAEFRAAIRLLEKACKDADDRGLAIPISIADIGKAKAINYPENVFVKVDYEVL